MRIRNISGTPETFCLFSKDGNPNAIPVSPSHRRHRKLGELFYYNPTDKYFDILNTAVRDDWQLTDAKAGRIKFQTAMDFYESYTLLNRTYNKIHYYPKPFYSASRFETYDKKSIFYRAMVEACIADEMFTKAGDNVYGMCTRGSGSKPCKELDEMKMLFSQMISRVKTNFSQQYGEDEKLRMECYIHHKFEKEAYIP